MINRKKPVRFLHLVILNTFPFALLKKFSMMLLQKAYFILEETLK